MNNSEILKLIEIFITDEDNALSECEQGDWFAMNHPTLTNILPKAVKILPEDQLKRVFFHLIRLGEVLGNLVVNAYPLLEQAYREQIPCMEKPSHFSMMDHFTGLFLFGFDKVDQNSCNKGYEDYFLFRKAYLQFTKYRSIPGMLIKPEKFKEFAENELIIKRLCDTLESLNFIQDNFFSFNKECHYYHVTNLKFWGGIFTLLLSPSELAKQTILNFESFEELPLREEQLEILDRYKQVAEKFLAFS